MNKVETKNPNMVVIDSSTWTGVGPDLPADIFSSTNLPDRIKHPNTLAENVSEAPTKYMFQGGVPEKSEEFRQILREAEQKEWREITKFPTNRAIIENTPSPSASENFTSSLPGFSIAKLSVGFMAVMLSLSDVAAPVWMKCVIALGFAGSNLYLDKKFQNPSHWRTSDQVVQEGTTDLLQNVPYFVDKINHNVDREKIARRVDEYTAETTGLAKFVNAELGVSIGASFLATLPVVLAAQYLGFQISGSAMLNIAYGCFAVVSIFTSVLAKQHLESNIRGFANASLRRELYETLPYGEKPAPEVPPTVISSEKTNLG